MRLRNILEIPMLSKVNKVSKDNPIFVFFLLYFVPTPLLILTPPFINFSKSLKPPHLFWPPLFIMNLRVQCIWMTSRVLHNPDPVGTTELFNMYVNSQSDLTDVTSHKK